MIARYAQPGVLQGIWLRGERRAAIQPVTEAWITRAGLEGDHGSPGKRAVTLIQGEHLPAIASMIGRDQIDAGMLRRNLVITGVNLNALRGRRVAIGGAILEISGICAPCSRMEEVLGKGGYSALRGHGGWCASVVEPGKIAVGDAVRPLEDASDQD